MAWREKYGTKEPQPTVQTTSEGNDNALLRYYLILSQNQAGSPIGQESALEQPATTVASPSPIERPPKVLSKSFGEVARDIAGNVTGYLQENPPRISPRAGVASVGALAAVASLFGSGVATAVEMPNNNSSDPNATATYLPDTVTPLATGAEVASSVNIAVAETPAAAPEAPIATDSGVQESASIQTSANIEVPKDQKVEVLAPVATNTPSNTAPVADIAASGVVIEVDKSKDKEEPATPVASNPIVTTPEATSDTTVAPATIDTAQINKKGTSTPEATPISTSIPGTSEVQTADSNTAVAPVSISLPEQVIDKDGNVVQQETAAPVKVGLAPQEPTKDNLPKLGTDATPEQVETYNKLQAISDAVKVNLDPLKAAALMTDIKNGFHDKSIPITTTDKNGELYIPETNATLETSIESLLNSYNGHSDPTYNYNARMAFAVALAVSKDQTVLHSQEIQSLIADVQIPTDPHQLKLLAPYSDEAKKLLETKNEQGKTLLDGFETGIATRIETVVAYLMLANAPDDVQKTAMDKIIADEAVAKAAEEAARKAAEEAAKNQTNLGGIEAIAADPAKLLQAAIERAATANGWSADKKSALSSFAQAGAPLLLVSSIGGSVAHESGFIPNRFENDDPINGIGLGWVQYSYSRRTTYEAAARNNNFNPRTDTSDAFKLWQAKYILDDAFRRGNFQAVMATNDPAKGAMKWVDDFEIPRRATAHNDARVQDAIAIFNQVSSQEDAIKQEAATAAATRIAAEAAQNAKMFTEIYGDESALFTDSTNVPCPTGVPGLTKARNDTGYYNGPENPIPIGLCELPNTSLHGAPALVNARIAGVVYSMFEQMRKDLGLKVIVLNDGFRTMADQDEAIRKYPKNAAERGKSNHQMGFAFDVNMGPANGGTASDWDYARGVNTSYPGNRVWEWLNKRGKDFHMKQFGPEGWHFSVNGK